MVKADAYGLGAEPVVKALAEAGCRRFYVAWPEEGAEVRRVLGPVPSIAVFHGPASDNLQLFQQAALEPVLNTLAQISLWISAGAARPPSMSSAGMNRLGLGGTL